MFDTASFSQFVASGCDRAAFVQNYLLERGVQSAVINVGGKRHIYAKLPATGYNAMFRVKTVIAHYDRFGASPGANDNSSSVFCLMDFAARLVRYKGVHNTRIFFTDGEELGAGDGVKNQGAFALAEVIQKAGIRDEDIFVFDCMGRGCVPILGTSTLSQKSPVAFKKKYAALEQGAKGILASLGVNWLSLPIPYSDNAGFLANGFAAVAFTMLPDSEAQNYLYALQNVPGLLEAVQNPAAQNAAEQETFKKFFPPTWNLLHTAGDNIASLTPTSFEITAKILDAIATRKTM